MKLVVFNGKHTLDISDNIIYFDYNDLGVDGDDSKIINKIKAFKPDLIIEEEKNDGKSLFNNVYKAFPKIPKAWWLIDAHCNLINHVVYAKQFDYIFCAQSWFIPIIEKETKAKVFYLPLSHTQTMSEYQEMLKTPVTKDINLSFIGNIRNIHVDREHHVRHFLEMYGDKFFARMSTYEKSLGYLRRSRVTLNVSLNNDLNFRVWEGIACNTLVLTDNVTDIQSIKGLSKYLLIYDKLDPDWTIMQKILTFDPKDGQNFIKQHTLTHRYLELLGMINTDTQKNYANS